MIRDLRAEPRGETYRGLLRAVRPWCPWLRLVVRRGAAAGTLLGELEPLLVERAEVTEWPGTVLLGETATRLTYRYDAAAADLMCEAAGGLYDWVMPELPEDPCLLRADGTPLLVTIAHESDGWLDVTGEEWAALLAAVPGLHEVA